MQLNDHVASNTNTHFRNACAYWFEVVKKQWVGTRMINDIS